MAIEKIAKELSVFNFTRDEIEVYLFLFVSGPSPASLVAKKLKANRMKAYRILSTLRKKGLVEIGVGRISQFIANPLIDALNREIEKRKEELLILEKNRQAVTENLEELKEQQDITPMSAEPKIRIIQGRQQVYAIIAQMLRRTREEVRIATSNPDLHRFYLAGIDDELQNLRLGGVRIRILTYIDQAWLRLVERYLSLAVVRHTELPAITRSIIVDDKESLTTFSLDDSLSMTTDNDICIWTNSGNYVKVRIKEFDALWSKSATFQDIVSRIETKKTLDECLVLARQALEAANWNVNVPGKILGESSIEHSFNLIVEHPDGSKLVVDGIVEKEALFRILEFRMKVCDVKSDTQILVAFQELNKKEKDLIETYRFRLVNAKSAKELAQKITDQLRDTQGHKLTPEYQ